MVSPKFPELPTSENVLNCALLFVHLYFQSRIGGHSAIQEKMGRCATTAAMNSIRGVLLECHYGHLYWNECTKYKITKSNSEMQSWGRRYMAHHHRQVTPTLVTQQGYP